MTGPRGATHPRHVDAGDSSTRGFMRNVVITGIGMASPIGASFGDAVRTFAAGRPVIRTVPTPEGRKPRAAGVVDEELTANFSTPSLRLLDRVSLLALRAGRRAFENAQLGPDNFDAERMGIFLGNGAGATNTLYELHHSLITRDAVGGMTLLRALPNAAPSQISMFHRFGGECLNLSSACSSAGHALGQALRAIRHGYSDVALAGGAEAPLGESHMRMWEAMRVMATIDPVRPEGSSRPFSKDRTGVVMGEGAVLFVLEAEEHARARGAHIHAVLRGYGTTTDGTHISAPDMRGQSRAMRACLADAGLEPSDIGYINAHGTATPAGDIVETRSIRDVFGTLADAIPVSSTKSIHGHLLGASGAIELVAALAAINEGVIAPTANLDVPDPECDLDYVPNTARVDKGIVAAMSNSFAFGGANATLIVTRA